MHFKNSLKTFLAALCLGTLAQTSLAQWQWMDKDGRKVFSDRSPPAEIAEKDIVKRPSAAFRAATTAAATASASANVAANTVDGKPLPAASAAASKASAPKLSGKDVELEARKKKAEDEEAAKKKIEDEKIARTKAENCERGKSGLATLQSGVRMASVNAKGEREIYDDNKRALETKRTQEIIDTSCK